MSSIVQTVVGAFPQGTGNTASASLTGVTAGNLIVVCSFATAVNTGATPSFSVSDGTSYTDATGSPSSNNGGPTTYQWSVCDIAFLYNASGGTHNVVSTLNTSTSSYGFVSASEVQAIGSGNPLDQVASNFGQPTANVSTGATGAIAQTNEISFAVFAYRSSGTPTIQEPTGYNNIFKQQNGGAITVGVGSIDYSTPLNAGVQNVNWGSSLQSSNWCAAIATFLGAGTAASTILLGQACY